MEMDEEKVVPPDKARLESQTISLTSVNSPGRSVLLCSVSQQNVSSTFRTNKVFALNVASEFVRSPS